MLIQVVDASKAYADRTLFANVSWQIDEQQRLGLVGPNGAGKTTLLAILTGALEPDSGRVIRPKDVRIGLLPQESGQIDGATALDAVLVGRSDLLSLAAYIDELQQRLAVERDDAQVHALVDKLGEAQHRFETLAGYELVAQAKEILSNLGFRESDFGKPPTAFSGGWRMRLLLARYLLQKPDLLLLDEPTNHLDLDALLWLESFLVGYPGSLVIVSHDRAFLNRTVNAVASLDQRSIRVYPGNYDAFVETRALETELLVKQALQQQKKIAQTQAFVERFRYKASKARQVQSRLRALEKLEPIELAELEQTVSFRLPEPPRTGHQIAELREVRKAYGDTVVYRQLDFRLYRGDRVALVGPNGSGKSTLLKILAGVVDFEGKRLLGEHVIADYYAQHQIDALDYSRTVLAEMQSANRGHTPTVVRAVLGAFLFDADELDKRVAVLSGGEKSRLALAKILLSTPNLLLMDEPTNHLDLASREALEEALAEYGGALVFISHDRYFIDRLANKVVHVEGGKLLEYSGNYSAYERAHALELARNGTAAPTTTAQAPAVRKQRRKALAELRDRKRDATATLRARVQKLEGQIAEAEARLREVEETLSAPATYADGSRVQALAVERAKLVEALEGHYDAWTTHQAELEQIDARFDAEERELAD